MKSATEKRNVICPLSGRLQIKGFCDSPIALPQFLDEIPVGIMVFNADRKVILINRALEALTGFLPQEAQGIPCCDALKATCVCRAAN